MVHHLQERGCLTSVKDLLCIRYDPVHNPTPQMQSARERFMTASSQSLESGEVKSILFKEMAELELYLGQPDPETRVLCTAQYPLTLWPLVLFCLHGTQETETRDSDLGSCCRCFPKWAFVLLRTVLTSSQICESSGSPQGSPLFPENLASFSCPDTWPFTLSGEPPSLSHKGKGL